MPEKPEIIIVRGEHRNEKTAWSLAPLVVSKLEKLGYKVRLETMPLEISVFGRIMASEPEKMTSEERKEFERDIDRKMDGWIKKIQKSSPEAIVFTMHNQRVVRGAHFVPGKSPTDFHDSVYATGGKIHSLDAVEVEIPHYIKEVPSQEVRRKHGFFHEGYAFRGSNVTDRKACEAMGLSGGKMVNAIVKAVTEFPFERLNEKPLPYIISKAVYLHIQPRPQKGITPARRKRINTRKKRILKRRVNPK